jgi:hypothetical protein
MRFACNLVGVTVRVRMRNEDIRERLKKKRIDEDIREYQKWDQLLEITDSITVPKIIMN